MKKIKRFFAILLIACMIMQTIPAYVNVAKAEDSTTSYEDVVTETGIKYVWYNDISSYRESTPFTYPEMEGYVFAGWYMGADESYDAVSEDTLDGSAWGKFVPEDVLTVKGQINKKAAEIDNDTTASTNLRLVTSLDSLRYQDVGFVVTMNGKTITFPMDKVYKKIYLVDDVHGTTVTDANKVFDGASNWFGTLQITNIPNGEAYRFTTMEIDVTPYWKTHDGTVVMGMERNRMLLSDERTNDEDGEDFTKSNSAYTYDKTTVSESTASYKYFKGGSNTVYLQGSYTTAGNADNHFGITIRNGGETRQLIYDGFGVLMYDGTNLTDVTAYNEIINSSDSVTIWSITGNGAYGGATPLNKSAISTMLADATPTEHEVIWAIYENMLYGSVDGQVFLRIPMTIFNSEWQDGRYYQFGVAAYNSDKQENKLIMDVETLVYGKEAKALLIPETEDVTLQYMRYEPITGSYMAPTFTSGSYAYYDAVSYGTPVGMETDLTWQDTYNSGSMAGVSIKLGDVSEQIYIAKTTQGYTCSFKNMSNHAYSNVAGISNVYGDVFDDTYNCNIKLAVYDGNVYILLNDVTAYECSLANLFGDNYTEGADISVGIATWDAAYGQTHYRNLTYYEGQDAIDMKLENWTFHPSALLASNDTTATTVTVDTADGTAARTGTGNYQTMRFSGTDDVWEITGTMTAGASSVTAMSGFIVSTSDYANSKLFLYQTKGFGALNVTVDTTKINWTGASYTNNCNKAATQYAFQPYDNNFGSTQGDSFDFKAVVANDTFYMWIDGELAWLIPLTDSSFGGFAENTEYKVSYKFGDTNQAQTLSNLTVKTGSEVDSTLLKTLKSANHMNWLEANAYKTLSTDGKVTTLNTTSKYTSHVVSSRASDSVWLSGTWEIAAHNSSSAANLFGITISDGTNSRQIGFQSQGIAVSQNYTFTVTSELNNIYYYNTANQSTGRTNGVIWAIKKTSDATNSPIVDMRTSAVGSKHELIWAIQDNTLYGSVNGVTCIILPLKNICSSWTDDANTQYYIGFDNWEPASNGDVAISDVELLFGENAETKLNTNALTNIETSTMFYDAIEDAYMPQFTSGFAGLYSTTASKTTGVQADIEWVDMVNAASGAGISVKTDTGSMQVYVQGANTLIRTLKNEKWDTPVALTTAIANDAVPFNSDGKSQVKALVANDTLYIYYNDVLGYELNLADYIDDYVAESSVQVGIATWDAYLGLPLFKNVKFLSADEVNTMMPRVSLGDASTTWEVNGTMTQEDLTTLVLQGFEITAGDKTLALLGKDYGFTANGTEYGYVASGIRYVKIDNEDYYNFFRTDGARTNTEINFRLRLVENKLNAWFDDVLVWDIPLTDEKFGGFASDAVYEISLFAENAVAYNVFSDWTVLQGADVKALAVIDETSSTTAIINEMTGTVIRTDDNLERVLFDGTSTTWEVTGTMKADTEGKWIPQGFAVKDVSSGKMAGFYGLGSDIQVYSPWKRYTDSRYALNTDTEKFFNANRTVDEVQFRLVLEEDVLFLWVDEVLSWRIPLTATQFGGFESGSVYQVGLAVNGSTSGTDDDGTFTYDNLVAKCGEDADTTGATKYTWTGKSAGVTVDAENAKAIFTAAAATEYIYFAQDDAETDAKYSDKWEITGTITRDDMGKNSVIGFMVEDENGNQAGYNFWSGNAVGVGKAWNWTARKVSDYPDNVYLNTESEEFAGRLNNRASIDYRVVILDDVLYAYFNDQLTWKLPLTDAAFGYTKTAGKTPELAAFTAGSNYRLGIKRVDQTPITVSNIKVKTGNAVLTESDFFMRDPYILANEADNTYYMYGTRYEGSFDVFSSSDLMVWTKEGQCFVAEDDFWGKESTTYWAPEVHEYNGEYYMFATFRGTYNGRKIERGTAILKSESGTPVGPFVEYSDGPVTPISWKCLDGTLYVENGTPYMVYCREYTDAGIIWPNVGQIYYQELSKDLKKTVGDPVLILDATDAYDYDFTPSIIDDVSDGYVTDGPQLYKVDGQLFLLWSTFVDGTGTTANNRYLQLQVRSADGTIAGLKDGKYVSDLPILYGSSEDEDGGHGMIFTDFNDNVKLSIFTPNKYLKTDSNKSHMELFDITYNKEDQYLEAN